MSSSSTSKPKVLALTSPDSTGEDFLNEFKRKFDLDVCTAKNRSQAIPEIASRVCSTPGGYQAFLVLMGTRPFEDFDAELLSPLVPSCKIIVSASAGYNEFDVNWMSENGIVFCNTRDAVSECTADMATFLILAVLRDASRAEKSTRNGMWRNDHVPTRSPSGLTLGILGMGSIGKYLAKKALVFNMRIHYYNRTRLPQEIEAKCNATYCSTLPELLGTSDVLSISCPLNASTEKLISDPEFSLMKDGAFFINTARGPIVDEAALIRAIERGKIQRAGLDVFENEPDISDYFVKSERCTIQPHLGGLTDVSRRKAERECLENIRVFFEKGEPVAAVNLDQVKNLRR